MGRAPCCDKTKVKRGPWSPEEDITLKNYLHNYGTGGNWISLPQKAGLKRCGKSCRLRWLNYLRPNIKRGGFTEEEDNIILTLYKNLGSRWSIIASHLQGRTDNDVKNYWNTRLKKKLMPEAITSSKVTTKATAIFNPSSATNSIYTASNQTMYYENQIVGISNQPKNVQELLLSDSTQFPLPKLTEAQENRLNKSTHQVSSISSSFSLEGGGRDDIVFMDFSSHGSSSSCDVLEGIVDFQGDSSGISPNLAKCMYSSFFDISNTEPSSCGLQHY